MIALAVPPSDRAPKTCVVIPALNAAPTVARVVEDAQAALGGASGSVIVVDDGSRDTTAAVAASAGALVCSHASRRGKGAALQTGFRAARARGFELAVTVDADGQHPREAIDRVVAHGADSSHLVLAVRDLARSGAPRANRASNAISNFFLSRFAGRALRDTQCGLRRYPLALTLARGARGRGFDYEAEILLRWAVAGGAIAEIEAPVLYPRGAARTTHFDSIRDPARIIATVLATLVEERRHAAALRGRAR